MCTIAEQAQTQSHTSADLKLGMFVDVLGPLPVEDKLRLIGYSHDVVLHGMAQEPETNTLLLDSKNKKLTWGSYLHSGTFLGQNSIIIICSHLQNESISLS